MDFRKLETYSPPCPICDGTRFQPLARNDRYGMGVQTAGCLRCGLLQTWPRPTPAAMAEFYRDHYREYYQGTPAPDAGYTMRYSKDERLVYTARLIMDNVGLDLGMRVLDIGCAEGTLFSKLDQRCAGLRFFGVEPSESFAAYARRETSCTTYPHLDDLFATGEADFDLVVLNHVLEHMDNPVELLRRLSGLLSPGGKLYVDVPDADRYEMPESLHIAHLFHFSERTLVAAMGRAGLRIVATTRHEPPHHPSSVWCVVDLAAATVRVTTTSVETERASWGAMSRLQHALPRYLLRQRLGRTRVAGGVVRIVRALRRRIG
jgi:SAM-dependent methyltransferase